MTRRQLIAFAGYKTSGKSESAKYLEANFAYYRTSFAAPLRRFGKAIGLTDHDMQEGKELPHQNLGGKTPREFFKTLGSAGLGAQVWKDLFVHQLRLQIEPLLDGGIHCVIDDARRENEFDLIKELGGVLVWVNRPGVVSDGHMTEQDLRHLCDFEIDNDGTLAALHAAVEYIAIKK